jgi:hypothetical protein
MSCINTFYPLLLAVVFSDVLSALLETRFDFIFDTRLVRINGYVTFSLRVGRPLL